MGTNNTCGWCDKPALFHLSRRRGAILPEKEQNTQKDTRKSEVARSCEEHKRLLAHWWLQGE